MNKTTWLIAGCVVAVGALLPPLHGLASDLFSAHMVQHLILVLVAAPLISLGAPRLPALGAVGVLLLHTGAMWAWHLPVAYDEALDSDLLHGLEHLSFVVTAVLFWGFVLLPGAASPLQRVGVTFATALQSSALGALIAFATRPLYTSHIGSTAAWDLTPLEDQQLAGAIMWVPPGVVYLVVMLVLLYRWFGDLDRRVPGIDVAGGDVR